MQHGHHLLAAHSNNNTVKVHQKQVGARFEDDHPFLYICGNCLTGCLTHSISCLHRIKPPLVGKIKKTVHRSVRHMNSMLPLAWPYVWLAIVPALQQVNVCMENCVLGLQTRVQKAHIGSAS